MRTPALLCALLLLLHGAARAQSSSSSHVLQQSTVNGGGAASASTSYRLTGSAGQESTIGASASFSWVVQGGFWSFLGSGLVPVVLTVAPNPADPAHVDLAWSGNNPPYQIYSSTDCAAVTSSWLATTPANDYPDVAPPAAPLVCYKVFATAPGPLAPPPD